MDSYGGTKLTRDFPGRAMKIPQPYTHTRTHILSHTHTGTHVSTHTRAHTQALAYTHTHTHTNADKMLHKSDRPVGQS